MEDLDKINKGIFVAMLIDELTSKEELIETAWRYEKEFPWVWKRIQEHPTMNVFEVIEDIIFRADEIDELFYEDSYHSDNLDSTKIDRIINYFKRRGSEKQRRNWNHKFRYRFKAGTQRTFTKVVLIEIEPGGLYYSDGNYECPKENKYYIPSPQIGVFLQSIYRDPNTGKIFDKKTEKEISSKKFQKFRGLTFSISEVSGGRKCVKFFLKNYVKKECNSFAKHSLRKRTDARNQRIFGEPLEGSRKRLKEGKQRGTVHTNNCNIPEKVLFDNPGDENLVLNQDEAGRIQAAHYIW